MKKWLNAASVVGAGIVAAWSWDWRLLKRQHVHGGGPMICIVDSPAAVSVIGKALRLRRVEL